MKKNLLIILLSCLPIIGWACTCPTLTKKDIKRISREADFVIMGSAVENVYSNDSIKLNLDKEKYGIEVKFKVEKVYKGKLNSDFVYINQFETGNCIQKFEFGEQYIIIGSRVKRFENKNPNPEAEYMEDEILISNQLPPPPPLGGLKNKRMKCYNIKNEKIEYWDELAQKEIVLYANQCSTFNPEGTFGMYFK